MLSSRVVPPVGPTNHPPLALVGEAPGEEEERRGEPFVGKSGFILNQMLAAAGIPRGECYITNVSQVRPHKNDFGAAYYEDKSRKIPTLELIKCRERVWQELEAVKPKVVVALGAEALKAVGHNKTLLETYRGTMIDHYGLRIIPTYHPAYILRVYGDRPIVEADLAKAYRQAINPSKPSTFFQINPSLSQVLEFLRQRPKCLSVDIETIGRHTRCIGFGWSKYDAISIPLIHKGSHHWLEHEETLILEALDKLFRSPDVEFILQNGPYDLTVMAREFGFSMPNYAFDTMFAHHVLYPELPKGLDFLSSVYTDHPMYWDYDRSNDEQVWYYNCMDCVVTFEVAEEIKDLHNQRGLTKFYNTVIHPAIPALVRVQSRGVLIDEQTRKDLAENTKVELIALRAKIVGSLSKESFNPSSPKQVKALVYDEWKMPFQFVGNGPNRRITTDDDALRALARKTPDAYRQSVLRDIILFRQKRVLLGNFLTAALDRSRARTSYSPAGTVTGRLASSKTPEGFGGNMQNIPRGKFRRIYIADPGKVMIKADLSQAEYRVLIFKARILRVIERLADPTFSIHYWNASENIYRVPRAEVTKKMYDEAKNGTYAANYNVGSIKVSRMYDIELPTARMIIERYHEAVPEIQNVYQKEIRDELTSTRRILNPLGRERIFFGRMDDELYRAAYSHYCQSTVADLINLALIDLDRGPDWLEILLQVHDELVVQVPREQVREGCDLVRLAMERPLAFPGVDVPLVIPVEIKVGYNWFDTKSLAEFLKEEENVGSAVQLS